MIRVRKPYSKFLDGRETLKGVANGHLPHGYRRYVTADARWGFPNRARPTPRYWFSGNFVARL